jgi:membrane protein DedA with SNARE-associated domain
MAGIEVTPEQRRKNRFRLALLLTPLVALSVAGTLADWFAAAIITEHPLLQIFMNPRIRYLALASNQLDATPYYLVGFFRLVLTDPLYFLFGRLYGDAALRWMERHWPSSEHLIVATERLFARASYPLVAVAPNGVICLLAGATGMRPATFVALNVGGTVARLVAIRAFAEALAGPIDVVFGIIDRYRWWLVGISVAIGLYELHRSRKAGRSRITSVSTVQQELEDAGVPVRTDED